ncbi:hypothetical protein SSP35_12_00460 [Streptomyces sp. NBRC 110611]|uniref:MbtH family protein n=1 Tax=Streptomyces sp. NBRC 110611 TaxID=1621259 RepID=UPI000858EE59|nr:MbtH family protein [Streptomyces sp. NBRC 110611]GAU69398.1 hypothetical protein SSP35_12_00460 [Streptomyces sp. NBRC 110611]
MTRINPFEDATGSFYVLVNDEGQHSLWPSFIDRPEGWATVLGPDSRQACLDHILHNRTDIRDAAGAVDPSSGRPAVYAECQHRPASVLLSY